MHNLEKRSTAIAAVLLTVVAVVTWSLNLENFSRSSILMYHIDVAVYLEGGLAFLKGENLYTQDFDFGSISLPFTYPPLSAILFSALAPFPLWLSSLVFIAASVVLLWWCCAIVLRHALPEWSVARTRLVALAVLPFAVALEPVRETLGFAQVNVFLMALVLVDTLAKKPWLPRGFWIGFAAAIKLTPAVFGLYFLVRREYRSAAVAVASGLGFTALAWVISPENSRQYWLDTLHDPSRIGGLGYAGNQSFQGFLARSMTEPGQDAVWKVLVVATIVAVAWAMYRMRAPEWAICLNSLVALLCSPVSWTHHWVWLVPLTLLAIVQAFRGHIWAAAVGIAAMAAMLLEPHWVLPNKHDAEQTLPISGLVLGSSYVWVAIAFISLAFVPKARKQALWWTALVVLFSSVLVLCYTFGGGLQIRHFIVFSAARHAMDTGVFTNPISITPLLAFLGAPLAFLRIDLASTLLVVANVAAVYWMARVILAHLRIDAPVALPLTALAVLAHPVRDTLTGGHWTAILVALVVADVFSPSLRWPRGLASGIAAACGGWPLLAACAAFAALKNYRALAVTTSVAVVSGGVSFLVAKQATLSYVKTLWQWPETTVVAFTGSINTTAYAFVARIVQQPSWTSWLVLAALVLAVAHFAVYRCPDRYVAAAMALCLPALLLPFSTTTIWMLMLPLVVLLGKHQAVIAASVGVFMLWFAWLPGQVSYITTGTEGQWWFPGLELLTSAPTLYLLATMVGVGVFGAGVRESAGGKMAQPSTGTFAKK